GIARLRERCSDRFDADRAAAEIDGDAGEIAPVESVEAAAVNLEIGERAVGDLDIDLGRLRNRGEVAYPAQEPAGDARGAARAPCNLARALLACPDLEHARRAAHDFEQFVFAIEIEPHRNAEPVAQRRGEEAGASGGTDEREAGKIDPD